MKHFVIMLLLFAIIICGIIAEVKIEESYVKTTTEAETISKTTKIETTAIIKPTIESTTIKIENERHQNEHLTQETVKDITTTKKIKTNKTDERFNKKLLGTFYITGYTAEEGFPYGSTTASGVGVKPGICAMNNSQRKELGIKYGDKIYIDGLGTFTVADCGCAYGVVDIWVYTNAEAYSMTGYYNVYI